jgi:hypothetical protein
MSRDIDSTVPLDNSWDIIYNSGSERIYEHSERRARMQIQLADDSVVTGVQLLRDTNDGWTVDVDLGMDDRTDHPESHKNEIVLEAERCFTMHKDDFAARDTHADDNDEDEPDVTETEHAVVIDNTGDQQTLEESLEGTDIITAG